MSISDLKGNSIIGFRYDATGVFGYEFYDDKDKIISVSSVVVPYPTVYINGFGEEWHSEDPRNSTIRYIRNKANEELAYIEYQSDGMYLIDGLIEALSTEESHRFYLNDDLLVAMNRIQSADWKPSNYYDWEPRYAQSIKGEIEPRLMLIIMSFPMLQFEHYSM